MSINKIICINITINQYIIIIFACFIMCMIMSNSNDNINIPTLCRK